MKDHSKEFRNLLDLSNIQKRLKDIKDDTNQNLCSVLGIPDDDIENLRKLINKNKEKAGRTGVNAGIPTGEIKFKGNIIPIDLIFERVNWLKKAYEDALNHTDKDKELELANDKLISTIFMLLNEENKKNQEKKEANDKALERKRYEDAEHSLKHKLLEQKGRGISVELTDKYEIIARLNTIGIGDRITFKDGYSLIIVGKKSGTTDGKNVKVRFEGTPSLSAEGHRRAEGEWWNLDNLLKISGTTIDDIRQLNIPPQLGKKPNKPNKPVKPDEPVNPVKPDEPVNPIKPDEPVNPIKPDEPVNPVKPDEPVNPVKPDEPVNPVKPDEPVNPVKPDEPVNPDEPKIFPPKGNENHDEKVIFEENAVLSDVSESYEDMISREVENEINEEWHNTARYNLYKRGKLWFSRGIRRKNKIAKMKENYERIPFTSNGTTNREMVKQATRHDLEEVLQGKGVNRSAFGEIKRENMIAAEEVSGDPLHETTRGKEFRTMAQDYVSGRISQVEFQNKFNAFVHDKLGLPKEQQFVATNILEKLDAIKNDNELLKSITSDLQKYLIDHNNSHFDDVHKKINDDFKKYRRDPRFRKTIMDILGNTAGLTKDQLDEKINRFIRHEKALANASATNLQIKLDLLTNGKGAYQTNNKDRENWLFRFGNKLDKIPRWGQALTVAGISASGMIAGGIAAAIGVGAVSIPLIGSISGAGLIGTATMSTLIGAKNFIKKWTHHTKEQNTYEKNLTRNYEEEIAKMKERERIKDEKDSEGKYTHGRFTRYRAKRQLELYGKATQEHLQNENEGNTKELSDFIYTALERYDSLNADEKNALNCTLLDAKARLETYWAKGHNFLKSKDKNQIEREFYDLENALNLSASRILGTGATLKDISLLNAHDGDGKAVNYNDLLNLYKKDYNSASKKFRGERAWLATKWGLGTAAITFGTSAAIQAATGTGMFAKEAVAGTPGTPESVETSNSATVSDNYGMGKYELAGGNKIFQAAQDNISGLKATDSVTLHLGSGTDGTAVRAGSSLLDHNTYLDKLAQVKDVISHSSLSNKADLINQLDSGFSTSGFTNADLHGMRCLEAIEETVKGAGSFAGKLNINYDTALDIDGSIAHDATSRMSQAFMEISKVIPGKPGTDAVEGGAKWLVLGLPRFSNTFKRNNDGKPEQKSIAPIIDEPNGKPNDKGDIKPNDKPNDKGTDKNKDKGHTSSIIIPPMKSDERDKIEKNTDKKEEITEELKKNVKDDLYKIFHTDDMSEENFKEKYKDSPWALKRLDDAKNFRKDFPKINFYDVSIVNGLKERYKENDYILNRINKELNTKLDSEFKHYLDKSEIDNYKDKAKSLVDSAILNEDYAKYGVRPMIVIKISDELTIPFYLSTGLGNKPGVPEGKFYPVFGIGTGAKGRLNKGVESEINNYYGSPLLAAIAKDLNNRHDNKSLKVEDWRSSNSDFIKMANLGKSPVDSGENGYDNINKTLKEVAKIKASD